MRVAGYGRRSLQLWYSQGMVEAGTGYGGVALLGGEVNRALQATVDVAGSVTLAIGLCDVGVPYLAWREAVAVCDLLDVADVPC